MAERVYCTNTLPLLTHKTGKTNPDFYRFIKSGCVLPQQQNIMNNFLRPLVEILSNKYHQDLEVESLHKIVVNVLDCDIIVREFEL